MGALSGRDREEYVGPAVLLPEVHHLGWTRPRDARAGALHGHAHAGWEICWLARGSVDWWCDDGALRVPPGHVYVTRPGERHGATDAVLEPCELFWLQVALPRRRALTGLDARATREVAQRLDGICRRVFPAPAELTAQWWALLGEHRAPDPLARVAAAGLLARLLAMVLRAAASHDARGPGPAIAAAQAHARERLDRGLPMAELARAAGLSPSRLHARFLAEVGQSPAEWVRDQRLQRAKQLLAAGDRPITDIALDLGFPSSQYFATVFRRNVGLTPRAYRRRAATLAT
jgi:AraC-like DNA-binding protein